MKQSKIRCVLQSIALLVLAGTAAAEPKLEKITHGRFEQIRSCVRMVNHSAW